MLAVASYADKGVKYLVGVGLCHDIVGIDTPIIFRERKALTYHRISSQSITNPIASESASHFLKRLPPASGHRIQRYLNQKSLNPFIFNNKEPGHFEPLICYDGGTQINGYEAAVLIDICDGILEARKHIELSPRQAIIAEQCEILVRSFAKVGLIALIDEATGYDKVKNKAKDNLQKWLNTFLAEEASRWVKTFPDSFFEMIYKMYGWTWTNSPKKPGVVGNIINDWVYLRLGPKVLEELDRLNPKNDRGHRGHRHHQNLSETIGKPALQRHLEALKALGAASGYDRARFLDMLNRAYPRPNEQFTFDFGDWE